MDHVMFIRPEIADQIKRGTKRYECRLALNRPLAWNVSPMDTLLIKSIGGDITLKATAGDVHKFEHLTTADIPVFGDLFHISAPYIQTKLRSRYAVVIELCHVHSITFPKGLTPRAIAAAWVCNFPYGHLAQPIV